MNIYLKLFLTFLKIGAFSFGGGYGMISVIREQCLANGWLTESELMNFIAIAESTPGPLAVNLSTFIGSSQAGFFGALLATIGVVLPSFITIMFIAAIIKNLLKFSGVKAALNGIKPVIIGLIVATGGTMLLSLFTGLSDIHSHFSINFQSVIIFAIICTTSFLYKKKTKKGISPILLILFSAVLGIAFFQ